MAGTFKEKDVGSGWPEKISMTVSQKLPEQKRLELERLSSKKEFQTPVQKQQVGCGWHCLWCRLLRRWKITHGLSKT
jgi:hypothetical protein